MRWEIDFGDRPWHWWFAWYPVRIHGTDAKVWWEWVERQTTNYQGYLCHQYQLIADPAEARRPTPDETT